MRVRAADAKVVRLLVSPEDAERLMLATHEGRIQFVLRDARDVTEENTPPVDDLYPLEKPKPVKVKYVPAPAPASQEIEVWHGKN